MRSYQKLHYENYYAQCANGDYAAVTRKECFAPAEVPSSTNPYPQKWFYDPDAGYAVRLARTKEGVDLGMRNAADLKADERYKEHQSRCVWKGSDNCNQKCGECCRQNTHRTVELDKHWGNDNNDDLQSVFDFEDETVDIVASIAVKDLLEAFNALLEKLSLDDRELWDCLKCGLKKQEIADKFHISVDGVRYREQKLFAKIRADKMLRSYFSND